MIRRARVAAANGGKTTWYLTDCKKKKKIGILKII